MPNYHNPSFKSLMRSTIRDVITWAKKAFSQGASEDLKLVGPSFSSSAMLSKVGFSISEAHSSYVLNGLQIGFGASVSPIRASQLLSAVCRQIAT